MRRYPRIDPHVHCRDGKQAYKDTIAHVLDLAEKQGVYRIHDMPNTDPPIVHEEQVNERFGLVPEDMTDRYFLYMGATSDANQLGEAVECWNKYDKVVGIKLYAGRSTGDLAVIEPEEQEYVYESLARLKYGGVLAVHCEKESLMDDVLFDYKNPVTHAIARPKEAEIESVRDQIGFAGRTGFDGILHICHASCPETVLLVDEARKDMKITCGVTPHHVMWHDLMLGSANGSIYKMNPPLRKYDDMLKLREFIKDGKVDWVETDHAAHTIGEKLHSNKPPSGYPSLYVYNYFVDDFLPSIGITKKQIRKLTRDNILETFSE